MSTERETVANLFHNYLGYGPITADGCADIAIAYADRRVAEAVRKMAANSARIIFTKSSDFDAIKRIRDLADALSPAREGGIGDAGV